MVEIKDMDSQLSKKERKRLKKERKRLAQEAETEASVETPDAPPTKKKKKSKVFKKKFYQPTQTTENLSEKQVTKFYEEHTIAITGDKSDKFKPVLTFEDANLDPKCLKVCKDFEKPTPIQSMCWPIITSGRDIIGIAETGSGKTLAFSVPALAHMLHRKQNPPEGETDDATDKVVDAFQYRLGVSQSPMMLVVAPTRELAMQSQVVLEKAGKKCKVSSVCVYGGVSKYEQRQALQNGVDVIVATPGRLIDFMEEGACDLSGVSYLVLDEADRMLDQGFEREIRKIIGATHAERQTCLFSATWPESIKKIASEFLSDPIRVTIGSEDLAAGKKVTQIVEVVEAPSRDTRLHKLLTKYHKNRNRILIFVLYKKEADRVLNNLSRQGWSCCGIHGDKSQESRIQAVEDFKSGKIPILVATDVAARGLDIPDVEFVINYSFPLTIEDYVHRIGRTGRAGKSGVAHTFFHAGDKLRAGELVNVLKESNQEVPKEMMQFDLSVKRKEHKLYGAFGPKSYNNAPMKKATKIVFDD